MTNMLHNTTIFISVFLIYFSVYQLKTSANIRLRKDVMEMPAACCRHVL